MSTRRRADTEYRFEWLLRRPMTARFDARRGVLSFPALFPGVRPRSAMRAELDAIVAARTGRGLPPYRRWDARRATVAAAYRHGAWSIVVSIRGTNHDYAVRMAMSLINELFLALQERYPEYLIDQFGFTGE